MIELPPITQLVAVEHGHGGVTVLNLVAQQPPVLDRGADGKPVVVDPGYTVNLDDAAIEAAVGKFRLKDVTRWVRIDHGAHPEREDREHREAWKLDGNRIVVCPERKARLAASRRVPAAFSYPASPPVAAPPPEAAKTVPAAAQAEPALQSRLDDLNHAVVMLLQQREAEMKAKSTDTTNARITALEEQLAVLAGTLREMDAA